MSKFRIPSDYKNQTPKVNHNWSSKSYGTIHPGLAYPVHHRHLNVGERIRGRIQDLVQSQPMLGPLMNGFKQITIATFLPDSAIYGWLRMGKRYNPTQYTQFGKVYFSAAGQDFDSYTDPVLGLTRHRFRLAVGLDAVSISESTPYDLWVDDTFHTKSGNRPLRHVGRGGLWDWLGVPAGSVAPKLSVSTVSTPAFQWQMAPFFTYFLSHYYYIANMQEDYMYFTQGLGDLSLLGQFSGIEQFPFSKVFSSISPNDFINCLNYINTSTLDGIGFDVSALSVSTVSTAARSFLGMICAGIQAHGGLLSVPYSPDLFGNIIKQGSSPTANVAVIEDGYSDTSYAVAVPELRFQAKIQNMLDRLFVSGGRPGDIFRTLWGTNSSPYVNKPDFLGVWQSSINPSNTVATANGSADGESMNVGQMAARVDKWSDYSKKQGIDYYAKEPGTFMLITMLVPDVSYCQGLHPDLSSIVFGDDYNPEMAGIGFTSVPRSRFSMMPEDFEKFPGTSVSASSVWFDNGTAPSTPDPNQVSVGEEVAWSWLRTDYPRLHGEFAQNGYYQYWVMPRRFTGYFVTNKVEGSTQLGDYSAYSYYGTYINPLDWQYLFVGQSFSDPNFCYFGEYDLRVTSSLPANYMPYLGR